MLGIRISARAAALASTVALVGGLGVTTAPALAGPNDHTMTVRINSFVPGWKARLVCERPDGSVFAPASVAAAAHYPTTPSLFPDYSSAVFSHVPDGTCASQTTNPLLAASGGTGSVSGVPAADGAMLQIMPTALAFACQSGGVLTGASSVGSTLVASPASFTGGLTDPASRLYTWYRSGQAQPVQSSTSPSYVLTKSDAAHQLSVVASGSLLGLADLGTLTGGTGTAACAALVSPVVVGSPTSTPPANPAVTGKPIVGHTVTAEPGPAPAGATIAGYQWYVKRVVRHDARTRHTVLRPIKGAHHPSLRMKERLAGKHVLVGVTYTFADGTHVTVYSKPLKVMKERMKE